MFNYLVLTAFTAVSDRTLKLKMSNLRSRTLNNYVLMKSTKSKLRVVSPESLVWLLVLARAKTYARHR